MQQRHLTRPDQAVGFASLVVEFPLQVRRPLEPYDRYVVTFVESRDMAKLGEALGLTRPVTDVVKTVRCSVASATFSSVWRK